MRHFGKYTVVRLDLKDVIGETSQDMVAKLANGMPEFLTFL